MKGEKKNMKKMPARGMDKKKGMSEKEMMMKRKEMQKMKKGC